MKTEYPLVLCFYMSNDVITSPMIEMYVESINLMIKEKDLNMVALFLPCGNNESERVECINPILVEKTDMEKINKLVEDIKTQFSVGIDVNFSNEEINIDEKQCNCNNRDCECR